MKLASWFDLAITWNTQRQASSQHFKNGLGFTLGLRKISNLPIQVATSQRKRVCLKRAMEKEYIETIWAQGRKTVRSINGWSYISYIIRYPLPRPHTWLRSLRYSAVKGQRGRPCFHTSQLFLYHVYFGCLCQMIYHWHKGLLGQAKTRISMAVINIASDTELSNEITWATTCWITSTFFKCYNVPPNILM